MPGEALGQLFSTLRAHQGKDVLLTLALGDCVLARVDMTLEDVVLDGGRLSLSGSFQEDAQRILYREVALPLIEEDQIEVALFAGEVRVSTEHGFSLELVPLDPQTASRPYEGL